ncbi:MAG: RNA polymerase sigma factor [Polyangia bacterium]
MVKPTALRRESAEAPAAPEGAVRPTFAELFESHFAFVWRTAHRLGTPEASLDDVVQETFVVAYRRQREFEGRSSMKTWLYGIVFNLVRAQRRETAVKYPPAPQRARSAHPTVLADDADGPHERAAKREAARLIDEFLQGLNEDQRDVFVLSELEQLTAPQVATILGAPLNTIYSRLRLARVAFAKAAARHRDPNGRRTP